LSTTYQPENVASTLDALESKYQEAAEPTRNGVSHAPGKMEVQLKGLTTRELPARDNKPAVTIIELEGEVTGPENTSPPGQLPNGRTAFGNDIRVSQYLNDVGLKIVKGWARTLGINTGSLKSDIAGIAEKAAAGTFVEVAVKHRTDKSGETRMDVFINRELGS
jgi:hypothetical protein